MSLAIATYVPEGIIMASDSRQSVNITGKKPDGSSFNIETINSDSVTKTFLLEQQKTGISNFGEDLIGGVPMISHINKFIEEKLTDDDDVTVIPKKLIKYFTDKYPNVNAGFHVAGYKKSNKVSIPYVYHCHIKSRSIVRRNVQPDSDDKVIYGATWSGQKDIIENLINPVIDKQPDGQPRIIREAIPIIFEAMQLQDAIDFSIYAIKTTIDTIRFQARHKNVGGPIDVLAITPDRNQWILRKDLHG